MIEPQPDKKGRAAIIRGLKAHSRATLDPDAVEGHVTSLAKESDRGAIIIAAAIIEDALHQALEERLLHLNKKEIDDLFDFNGPMGSFSARIKCAQAFGIIDRATRNHIEVIREMRNACAHSQKELTFKDAVLHNAVFSMLTDGTEESYGNDDQRIRALFILLTTLFTNIIFVGDTQKGAAEVNAIIAEL